MSTFSPTYSANPIYTTVNTASSLSGNIVLTNMNISTYNSPVTATGEFLGININGIRKYLKIFKS